VAARHFFVQSDKETKQRKRFNRSTLSVHSVQFLFIGAPKARCSQEHRMCETLLLANPDTNTLRPVRSRASTSVLRTRTASRVFAAAVLRGLATRFALLFRELQPHAFFAASFRGRLAKWFVMRTNSEGGFPRIARGAPWAGSVTGGEACGYPCSEKEGFTHPWLWRAPCFWGTHELELHAVDT
jgi:hypothetical protein